MINRSDASFVFGDKLLVLHLNVILAGKIQRRSHILNYHCTRKSQSKGITKFVHMNGNDNPADIVTNRRAYKTWSLLMKPLLFWHDMELIKERVVSKGIENRLLTPPLSQSKINP